jgi:D-alanine-D-alanine ligase
VRTLVAVIGGGTSAEREVSLSTARAVRDHLPRDEFDVLPVEVLPSGRWRLRDDRAVLPEDAIRHLKAARTGVVFIGLHGAGGEDGRLQAFLEVAGLPYVGSGVTASAIAMDKSRTREVLAAHGFKLAPGIELAEMKVGPAASLVLARIGLPAVVKDPCGGSSIGVSLAATASALRRSLRPHLDSPGGRVLVEKYVRGRELSVPVIGNASTGGRLEALPPILIRPHRRAIFDYRSKYDPKLADELCPAPVAPSILRRVADAALLAHRVLRCDGITRSDFIVPRGGTPRFLEVNTLPGMTANSLCPKSAAAAGLPFPELLRRLVRLAVAKWGRGGR